MNDSCGVIVNCANVCAKILIIIVGRLNRKMNEWMYDAMCECGYAWRKCLKSFGCANEVLRGATEILENGLANGMESNAE